MSDYKAPRTQADLDALRAEDVSELTDSDLAAAFARLVAGNTIERPRKLWWSVECNDRCNEVYWFNMATVDAMVKRGWNWHLTGLVEGNTMALAIATSGGENARIVFKHADPARALLSTAVLAAIAERDAG